MGRSPGPMKSALGIRIRTDLLTELYLLNPELQRSDGHTKYAAVSSYFERLIREDLERRKASVIEAKEATP